MDLLREHIDDDHKPSYQEGSTISLSALLHINWSQQTRASAKVVEIVEENHEIQFFASQKLPTR